MKRSDEWIVEGIVTSVDAEGVVNITPMGPWVDAAFRRLRLRPFKTAQTYQNLKQHPEGVFHVTDDVLLLAQAAVGQIEEPPILIPATQVRGYVLQDACRFFEFRVESVDDTEERTEMVARVVTSGRQRDFLGFNRAKHAVLEAAILATRLHLLPKEQVAQDLGRLRPLVEKTGSKREHQAFAFLERFIATAEARPA